MTKLEYARLRIDEILIELPEDEAGEIVKKLAEDYEIIPKEGEIF